MTLRNVILEPRLVIEEMDRLRRGLGDTEATEGVASGQDPYPAEFLICEVRRGRSHFLHL